jgi:hypothetical protein
MTDSRDVIVCATSVDVGAILRRLQARAIADAIGVFESGDEARIAAFARGVLDARDEEAAEWRRTTPTVS